MFLPGMNYQDATWEPCKKALGLAWLQTLKQIGLPRLLDARFFAQNLQDVELSMSRILLAMQGPLSAKRNLHDIDAYDLATELLMALTSQFEAAFFSTLLSKTAIAHAKSEANLPDSTARKIANDVFADLRDEIDVQRFCEETGESMTVNRLHNIRKVDQASNAVKVLLEKWSSQREYVSLILGYDVLEEPKEHRAMRQKGRCQAQWLLNWSEHYGRFHPLLKSGKVAQGCFHTRSKQFVASVANIEAILKLIDPETGRYHPVLSHSRQIDPLRDTLAEIEADLVDDSAHPSRVRAHQNIEDESGEGGCEEDGEVQQPAAEQRASFAEGSEVSDELEFDADTDSEETYTDDNLLGIDELFNAQPALLRQIDATPSNEEIEESEFAPLTHEAANEAANAADEEENSPWSLVRQKLHAWAQPIQVGVLRDLSKNLDPDDLLDALDFMGIFTQWKLPRDIASIGDVELARHMPCMKNGKSPSPASMKNWINQAKHEFLQQIAQMQAEIRHSSSAQAKTGPRKEK